MTEKFLVYFQMPLKIMLVDQIFIVIVLFFVDWKIQYYLSFVGPVREVADHIFVVSFPESGLNPRWHVGLVVADQGSLGPAGCEVGLLHHSEVAPANHG